MSGAVRSHYRKVQRREDLRQPNDCASQSGCPEALTRLRKCGLHDKGRSLPKFGEWDVNNPASAEGYTVIFSKARDEKKNVGSSGSAIPQPRNEGKNENSRQPQKKQNRWFCCCCCCC